MTIFFSHIPKSAGTTFRNILINNYSWRHLDWAHKIKKTKSTIKHFPFNSPKAMKKLESISGHCLRYDSAVQSAYPSIKYVTFLRDPVSRLVSLYFHILRTWNPKLSFHEWTLDAARPELSNFQTRFIAGSADLKRAETLLSDAFFFVGKAERFDESICFFKRMIGNSFDNRYESLRVSKQRKDEFYNNDRNQKALERLRQNNTLDLKLNDYIEQNLFPTYKAKYGDVQTDCQKIKQENQNFEFSQIKKNLFLAKKNIINNPLLYLINR